MKILEYKPNLGSFSLGFETFSQNEVVEVVNLSKNAEYAYNKTHKQWFLPNFSKINEYKPQKSFDLAILNPNLGEKLGRRGKNKFITSDLHDCLTFVERERPKFVIFTVDIHAIPLLNTAKEYIRDSFGEVSKDFIIYSLQQMGYDACLVAIDEANYGIPIHKRVGLYIATPKDYNIAYPKGLFTRLGINNTNKFRTIADAISDLGSLGEWVPYGTRPRNIYQKRLRGGMEKTTWHFLSKAVSSKQAAVISQIRQGSKAAKNKNVRNSVGYVRPRWDRICPGIDEKFYLTSSTFASLHPILNRPFTIREGMRIMGLPDYMSFDLKTSKPEVAKMIVKSIAPVIGEATAIALRSID